MKDFTINKLEQNADEFAYITLKMQSLMHVVDKNFYNLENTVNRINSCIFACINEDDKLLDNAKYGILKAFNRLKNEENLPILSYETVDEVIKTIDYKIQKRSA